MNSFKTIAIIGAGHLGSALARGLIQNKYPPHFILFSNRDAMKSTRLVKELGVLAADTNTKAVELAEIVILAVNPQYIKDVCLEIAPIIQKTQPLIISLAGVINIKNISSWLNYDEKCIARVMTNTPMEIGKGTSALFVNASTSFEQKQCVEHLFNQVGYTFFTEQESMLDTLTVPVGCAPAYVFLFLEALQQAAISRGIQEYLAKQISLESVLGAAELAKKSGLPFSQLRAGVTTSQGVTDYSLQKMSIDDFFDIFKNIFARGEERIEQIQQSIEI